MLTKQTMNKERLLNGDGVVFNKKLFELLGFFKILGPKNSFYFKLFLAISIWISLTIVFSILGIVYSVLYGFINNDQLTYLIIFLYTNYLLVLLKLITFILNNNNILKVLDITKINFIQSHQCKFQVGEVLKLRNSDKKITTFYVFLFCIVAIIWSLFPIAYNILIKQKTSENRSIIGVMDLYYPITLQSYQTYYILFDINEVLLGLWLIWATLIYDLFLFTSFWVFAKHYETLTLAFENFNFNGIGKTETFQMYKKLIAIISDCQNVNIAQVLFNNQPIEVLLQACQDSIIKRVEPVWFGCQIEQRFSKKLGQADLEIHDFNVTFGTEVSKSMSKAERITYQESSASHAMIFIGINLEGESITKLCVENSWGRQKISNGYLMMTAEWFKEYVFELVVDKTLLPESVLQVYNQEPIVLKHWDPLGKLLKLAD